MALHPAFFLSLWGLMLCVYGSTASLCNVTCSTDYAESVNCSCSGPVHTYPVLLEVNCRDDDGDEESVNGSCVIEAPHTWCWMYLEELYSITSIGTTCTTTVSQPDDEGAMAARECSSWDLSDVVKSSPPFNVQVTNTDDDSYNISWNTNITDRLNYRVRIRAGHDLLKEQSVNEKHFLIYHNELPPHAAYIVDVQAQMCGPLYYGPWSEWSSTSEWRAAGTPQEDEGLSLNWWFVFLPVVVVLLFLVAPLILQLLGYIPPPRWSKTLSDAWRKYTPNPDDFFTPLYQTHGGNFKEWAKPIFSEFDYLRMSSAGQRVSEKQHDVLHWNDEKKSYGDETHGASSHFLHAPPTASNAPLLQYQDGGSSQRSSRFMEHISIHTVTLSGDEFRDEVTSQSSIRTYQDGESFGSLEDDGRAARLDGDGVRPVHHENQISLEHLNFQLDEPDQLFLDSFVSNEQSEDGYPHVDLDTIDSGFGECSSPAASNTAGQTDLFTHEHKNSNYVKQWMACSGAQEDAGSADSGLHDSSDQSC
ncbi:interleukin 21 receptor, tandem duplicate 1 [Parambassis ranga]|uniref:Interleukin-21 receptor-like n=1 Tax=Parambassis ranga TaxID=210632 RepID=A0A6P7JUG4_9TELE|nr:interleukin-21 receptor-like [Parambassis ranga]XP_028280563.1 interleukin-21 receptor-like [Parambassis ranga]XP_028280564.1 interleukin-21 receptor-like [Parambassis ranga]